MKNSMALIMVLLVGFIFSTVGLAQAKGGHGGSHSSSSSGAISSSGAVAGATSGSTSGAQASQTMNPNLSNMLVSAGGNAGYGSGDDNLRQTYGQPIINFESAGRHQTVVVDAPPHEWTGGYNNHWHKGMRSPMDIPKCTYFGGEIVNCEPQLSNSTYFQNHNCSPGEVGEHNGNGFCWD